MDATFILMMMGAIIVGRTINGIWPWNSLSKPPWQGVVALIVLGGGYVACWSAIR